MRMARWLLAACLALLLTLGAVGAGSPRIAGEQYVYELSENGKVCLYVSFKMSFKIYYERDYVDDDDDDDEVPCRELRVPNNTEVIVSGECENAGKNGSSMVLSWKYGNSLEMTFSRGKHKWELERLKLTFNYSAHDFNLTEGHGLQTFFTNGSDLFSRTFKKDEYFYCKNSKSYTFGQYDKSICEDCLTPCVNYTDQHNKSKMYCSTISMEKSVIYSEGDPSSANKRLCLEDYIELQEIIVPIAVGGVLALLLVFIFVAYVIAYVRRRRREAKSQYEPVGDF